VIKLIDMTEHDLFFINTIRNNESTRSQLMCNNLISIEETIIWFKTMSPKWFIINIDNKQVGYMRISRDTGKTICIGCDIHPDYRRKGYAKVAYELLISNLYNSGYDLLWLEVFKDNIPAYNLYSNLGFLRVGDHKIINNREYIIMVHVK